MWTTSIKSECDAPFLKSPPLARQIIFFKKSLHDDDICQYKHCCSYIALLPERHSEIIKLHPNCTFRDIPISNRRRLVAQVSGARYQCSHI